MNAAHVAVLAALPAIALSWLYLLELWLFTRRLRLSAPELWRSLGEPTLGASGRAFLVALAGGRLGSEPRLPPGERPAVARLRAYLLVGVPLWICILAIWLFRRQLGLAL